MPGKLMAEACLGKASQVEHRTESFRTQGCGTQILTAAREGLKPRCPLPPLVG